MWTFSFIDWIAGGADFEEQAEFCRGSRLRRFLGFAEILIDGKVSPRLANNRDSIFCFSWTASLGVGGNLNTEYVCLQNVFFSLLFENWVHCI